MRLAALGSLSTTSSAIAARLKTTTAAVVPMKESGRDNLSQPKRAAHAVNAGGVSDRNPTRTPISNAKSSVIFPSHAEGRVTFAKSVTARPHLRGIRYDGKSMLISATRLRIRSALVLLPFVWRTFQSQRQVVRAPGFLGGRLLIDRKRTFWTLTAWETEKAMRDYRGSGAHQKVMPRLVDWCDEALVVHWTTDGTEIPPWPEAFDRLRRDGRPSRVAHPTRDHEARRFPAPRLKPMIGQDLHPHR